MAYVAVLDDHSPYGDDLSRRLAEHGHSVCLVRDVQKGMAIVALAPPDVLVIDASQRPETAQIDVRSLCRIAPLILLTDSFDEAEEEPWSFEANPFCTASTSVSCDTIVDMVEALLVPLPEEALR